MKHEQPRMRMVAVRIVEVRSAYMGEFDWDKAEQLARNGMKVRASLCVLSSSSLCDEGGPTCSKGEPLARDGLFSEADETILRLLQCPHEQRFFSSMDFATVAHNALHRLAFVGGPSRHVCSCE